MILWFDFLDRAILWTHETPERYYVPCPRVMERTTKLTWNFELLGREGIQVLWSHVSHLLCRNPAIRHNLVLVLAAMAST